MISKSFKGDLSKIGLPDLFEYLRRSHKTGILAFRQDRVKKSLYMKDGTVIFARSNLPEERLGDLLLASGVITKAQYNESVALLSSTKRQGKILVEIGAISPGQLWEGVQNQIRHIAYTLFNWQTGIFYFVDGELPGNENITANVGISELIMEGIRRITDTGPLMLRFNSRSAILERAEPPGGYLKLEPFESHTLGLVDGKRTLLQVCSDSEIGEAETMKVLYMLLSIGYVRIKDATMREAPEDSRVTANEATAIIANYNRMFSYLYRYMTREVGPITEFVLKKYLTELMENHAPILKNVGLKKDGTLDGTVIRFNLSEIRQDKREELLMASLNEFLYASILAVKRTLGAEHESRVIETLKDLRPEL